MKGLIATQIKLEVKMKMNALTTKAYSSYSLGGEIKEYLAPSQTGSREHIAKIALEKVEGNASIDLAARIADAVQSAILEEFHKGIDQRMRSYML